MRHFAPAAAPIVYSSQVGPNHVTYVGPGTLGVAGTTFNRVYYTGVGTINAVADSKDAVGVAVPGVSLSCTSDGRFDAGTKDGSGNAAPVDTTGVRSTWSVVTTPRP